MFNVAESDLLVRLAFVGFSNQARSRTVLVAEPDWGPIKTGKLAAIGILMKINFSGFRNQVTIRKIKVAEPSNPVSLAFSMLPNGT